MNLLRDAKKLLRVTVQRAASLVRPPQPALTVESVLGSASARGTVDEFHTLWYATVGAGQVRWQGHEILKNPLDLWIYQEIIHERRPDLIIETGTHHGGSALYLAMMARLTGIDLRILTLDFNPKLNYDPSQYGIVSIVGISTSSATVQRVRENIQDLRTKLGRDPRVMVVLDSDHSRENVLEELRVFSPFVTAGDYLIVEDTNVNGHPVNRNHGPGPYEAVTEFLATTSDFVREPACNKFLFTLNPDGWLRRVR